MDKKIIVLSARGLEHVGMITNYTSIMFKNESKAEGSFELWCPINENNLEVLKSGNLIYLSKKQSGIIQYIDEVIAEDGSKSLNIKGKTTKYYASYRMIMNTYNVKSKYVTGIMNELMSINFVSPTDINRKFVSVEFSPETEYNTGKQISVQQTGGQVADMLSDLSDAYGCSYDFDLDLERKMLQFKAYKGVDRTLDQLLVEPVILTTDLNDLLGSKYTKNISEEKNVAMIAGQGEGVNRKVVLIGEIVKTDVDRKEIFVDARDLSSTVTDSQGVETELSDEEYQTMLSDRGNIKMNDVKVFEGFDSSINISGSIGYKYGVDYFLGDTITVEDKRLGLRINAEVSTVEEVYSGAEGHVINVTFGYLQPNIIRKLKEVQREANSSQSNSKIIKKVGDIEKSTTTMSEVVNLLVSDSSGTKQTISNIQQSIMTITQDVSTTNGDVAILKTTTRDTNDRVNVIENTATQNSQTLTALDSRVTTVSNTVDGMVTQASSTLERVNSIQQTVDGTTLTVSSLSTTVGNLNTTVVDKFSQIDQTVDGINLTVVATNATVSDVSLIANSAKSSIDNLEIGGRNLLLESTLLYAEPRSANYVFKTVNNIISYEYTSGGYHYVTTANNGAKNSSRGIAINSKTLGLKVGDTVTYSNDIKGTFGTFNNGMCIMHATTENSAFYSVASGSMPHPLSIPDWTRVSRTYTIPSDIGLKTDGSFWLYLFWGGGTGSIVDVYVKNIKLERGNKATDWTPAPEDVKAYSDTVAASTLAAAATDAQTKATDAKNASTGYTDTKTTATSLVSTINQTAEAIKIAANKLELTGLLTIANAAASGQSVFNGDNLTTGTIKSNNYVPGFSGMKITLDSGELISRYTQLSADGTLNCQNLICTNAKITGGSIILTTTSYDDYNMPVILDAKNITPTNVTYRSAISAASISNSCSSDLSSAVAFIAMTSGGLYWNYNYAGNLLNLSTDMNGRWTWSGLPSGSVNKEVVISPLDGRVAANIVEVKGSLNAHYNVGNGDQAVAISGFDLLRIYQDAQSRGVF